MGTSDECLRVFDDALASAEKAFRTFEDALPPPNAVKTSHGWAPRYRPELLEHALLLKFARLISVTSALRELVVSGHVHEQGILQRIADETGEDIFFLALGKQNGIRAIHRQYLKNFWREEFEGSADPKSYQPRHMVRRNDVREYIDKQMPNEARAGTVSRMIYGVFSGFVHGASTHIFDLFDPQSGRYRLTGKIHADEGRLGYLHNAANYPLRTLMAGVVVARSLGEPEAAAELLTHVDRLQQWFDEQEW
jgi:hypothetical protein